MNINSLLQLGASLIQGNSDDNTTGLATNQITNALADLLGGEGKLDFGTILSTMQSTGLGDIAASWIGKGKNLPISAETITNVLSPDKVAAFAAKLGLSESSAKTAIADALPRMIDQASPEGSILESFLGKTGGVQGLLNLAGKLV
ncbi:MAG: DUF937 domain-containing protein [Chlorobiaceae bacterium]|jgi:uncharacterized protein YidB (DUF937 family)|nr:DUF937 domain-containing protein [Chlorobiaceae bacterium]NTW62912.1 DUF937 domain-containing protein [Chlorobiaceae bacterium]